MDIMAAQDSDEQAAARSINPFGYWPELASGFRGLGGTTPSADPAYVFHTAYEEYLAGPTRIELCFSGLVSSSGTILTRVLSFAPLRGNAITEVVALDTPLRRLVKQEGRTQLVFEADPTLRYAILGYFRTPGEAVATSLEIAAIAFETMGLAAAKSVHPRSTFGGGFARRVRAMTSARAATFSFPVSQSFDPAQREDREYRRWVSEMTPLPNVATDEWEVAYVLQTLSAYGRLASGARGVGMGTLASVVADVAARDGCTTSVLSPDLKSGSLSTDLTIPTSLDFLWIHSDTLVRMGRGDLWKVIDDALDLLSPAGLAIFLVPFDPVTRHSEAPGRTGLGMGDLKRLNLDIVMAGHIVSQLRADVREGRASRSAPPPLDAIPFGIIVRKFCPPDFEGLNS